jgi:hypothetical protein
LNYVLSKFISKSCLQAAQNVTEFGDKVSKKKLRLSGIIEIPPDPMAALMDTTQGTSCEDTGRQQAKENDLRRNQPC